MNRTGYAISAAFATLLINADAQSPAPVEIEDAIRMTRIQRSYRRDEDIVFSPDGSKFVCVVLRGDLGANLNVHSLLMFDVRRLGQSKVLLSEPFQPDELDQHATPIAGMRFVSNSVVAFIGSLGGKPAQVYTIDVDTKELRQLTAQSTPVRSFGASAEARVLAFSAFIPPDERRAEAMNRDGFSVFDEELATPVLADQGFGDAMKPTPQYYWGVPHLNGFAKTAYGRWYTRFREYFVSPAIGGTRRLLDPSAGYLATTFNDARLLPRPDLTLSPTGTHALVFPFTQTPKDEWVRYRYFRQNDSPFAVVTSFGLVDLRTARIERLLPVPGDFHRATRPLWSPDGTSVVVASVPPGTAPGAYDTDPHLLEVDIATRRFLVIPHSAGWQPVQWLLDGDSLIVRNGAGFGIAARRGGTWQPVSPLVTRGDTGFNPRYDMATNGSVVVGVKDSLTTPPELALYDVASRQTTVLTKLNPDLKHKRFADVEKIFWPGPAGDTAFGYLVKPIGFVRGRRYPAVILLKDESRTDTSDDSFIIDGQQQLSGWAIQTFAAHGLLVLLTPPPSSHSTTALTAGEGPRIVAHVENAITHLDKLQIIDRRRVGLSGWSRAAYWTNYVIAHPTVDIAAATDIDGGGNYKDFQQLWGASDAERDAAGHFHLDLRRVRTPLLSEQHGASSLLGQSEFISALRVLGKPVDLYYYPHAPHSLRTPMHRLYSLRRHLDWFRFWLQDYEDPDPLKHGQYERWRRLRALQSGPTVEE